MYVPLALRSLSSPCMYASMSVGVTNINSRCSTSCVVTVQVVVISTLTSTILAQGYVSKCSCFYSTKTSMVYSNQMLMFGHLLPHYLGFTNLYPCTTIINIHTPFTVSSICNVCHVTCLWDKCISGQIYLLQ